MKNIICYSLIATCLCNLVEAEISWDAAIKAHYQIVDNPAIADPFDPLTGKTLFNYDAGQEIRFSNPFAGQATFIKSKAEPNSPILRAWNQDKGIKGNLISEYIMDYIVYILPSYSGTLSIHNTAGHQCFASNLKKYWDTQKGQDYQPTPEEQGKLLAQIAHIIQCFKIAFRDYATFDNLQYLKTDISPDEKSKLFTQIIQCFRILFTNPKAAVPLSKTNLERYIEQCINYTTETDAKAPYVNNDPVKLFHYIIETMSIVTKDNTSANLLQNEIIKTKIMPQLMRGMIASVLTYAFKDDIKNKPSLQLKLFPDSAYRNELIIIEDAIKMWPEHFAEDILMMFVTNYLTDESIEYFIKYIHQYNTYLPSIVEACKTDQLPRAHDRKLFATREQVLNEIRDIKVNTIPNVDDTYKNTELYKMLAIDYHPLYPVAFSEHMYVELNDGAKVPDCAETTVGHLLNLLLWDTQNSKWLDVVSSKNSAEPGSFKNQLLELYSKLNKDNCNSANNEIHKLRLEAFHNMKGDDYLKVKHSYTTDLHSTIDNLLATIFNCAIALYDKYHGYNSATDPSEAQRSALEAKEAIQKLNKSHNIEKDIADAIEKTFALFSDSLYTFKLIEQTGDTYHIEMQAKKTDEASPTYHLSLLSSAGHASLKYCTQSLYSNNISQKIEQNNPRAVDLLYRLSVMFEDWYPVQRLLRENLYSLIKIPLASKVYADSFTQLNFLCRGVHNPSNIFVLCANTWGKIKIDGCKRIAVMRQLINLNSNINKFNFALFLDMRSNKAQVNSESAGLLKDISANDLYENLEYILYHYEGSDIWQYISQRTDIVNKLEENHKARLIAQSKNKPVAKIIENAFQKKETEPASDTVAAPSTDGIATPIQAPDAVTDGDTTPTPVPDTATDVGTTPTPAPDTATYGDTTPTPVPDTATDVGTIPTPAHDAATDVGATPTTAPNARAGSEPRKKKLKVETVEVHPNPQPAPPTPKRRNR